MHARSRRSVRNLDAVLRALRAVAHIGQLKRNAGSYRKKMQVRVRCRREFSHAREANSRALPPTAWPKCITQTVRLDSRPSERIAFPPRRGATTLRAVLIMTATEKLLRALIALPSVNPAFLPLRDPRAGEWNVAEFLAATAAGSGLDVELQPVFPNRSNLIARLEPTGTIRQRVVLAPHMDTVGDAAMPDTHFRPVRKAGRLHGRGACDTKGSVAAMLSAVMAVARDRVRPAATEIVFIALVDEEHAQAGSRALMQTGFEADLAIVGEPTRLRVVTAHKGAAWLMLETRGRAAHGARPELGRNAVHAMCRVVGLLETRYAAQLRRRRHPLVGHPTVNVGFIQGGRQANIVPDRCVIALDRRTIPGETTSGVLREIKALLQKHKLGAGLTDSKDGLPCLPLETNHQLPLVRQFMRCAVQRQPVGVDYFSDASVLAQGGIPSVVFGPGDIAQAHTRDEWISLASLDRATAMLTKFLRSLP